MSNYDTMDELGKKLKNHVEECEKLRKDLSKFFKYIQSNNLTPVEIWYIGFQMGWKDNDRAIIV